MENLQKVPISDWNGINVQVTENIGGGLVAVPLS